MAEAQANPQANPKKRRGNGVPFKKGDPRIAPLKRAAEAALPVPDRVDVAGEGLLADYRFVAANDPRHDDTPMRRALRTIFVDNPAAFVRELRGMEDRAGAAAQAASLPGVTSASDAAPVLDPGSQRAVAILNRILSTAAQAAGVER